MPYHNPGNKRVGRLREKQYQLAAQKNNEAFFKYDYHRQNARYFERESTIARHYDSWNFQQPDREGHLEKARKTEHLLGRRNRLRSLLKEEDEIYQRELGELKSKRNLTEQPSLETLKDRLKERRAEESLYLPRTCRRFQLYHLPQSEPGRRNLNTLRNTNLQCTTASRDLDDFTQRNGRNSHSDSFTMRGKENGSLAKEEDSRDSGHSDYGIRKVTEPQRYTAHFDRQQRNSEVPSCFASSQNDMWLAKDAKRRSDSVSLSSPRKDAIEFLSLSMESADKHGQGSPKNSYGDERGESSMKHSEGTYDNEERKNEKSLSFISNYSGEKNITKEMLTFLTHKAVKGKIEDLTRSEMLECRKHSWNEAMRFRDMRNRLELIDEKQLYSTDNFALDKDVRKLGLENIKRKEKELARREDAYMDSEVYSDRAKDLLKEWVREDENSMRKEAKSPLDEVRVQRDVLMHSLEKDWQNLATQEKSKISRSFRNILSKSNLQEEQQLIASLTNASGNYYSNDNDLM